MAKWLTENGVTILTIDISVYGVPNGDPNQGSSFGDRCFRLSNNKYFLENLEDLICKGNVKYERNSNYFNF